jgi:hypothetical protein
MMQTFFRSLVALTVFMFILVAAILLGNSSAFGADKIYKGQNILVAYACENEGLMLEVAEVDAQDTNKAGELMKRLFMTKVCHIAGVPIQVVVKDIVLVYNDSDGKETYLLELVSDEQRFFVFYLPEGQTDSST